MINKQILQAKIYKAVDGFTLTQIEAATNAQIANAASLTKEEIAYIKRYKFNVRRRLIATKKEHLYREFRDGTALPAFRNILTAMEEENRIGRSESKRQLSRMHDDLQGQL